MDSTNRFRQAMPRAVPWRERASTDPVAHALLSRDATDAEAAAVFAAAADEARDALRRHMENCGRPTVTTTVDGRRGLVRGGAVEELVRAAVLAEREACAKVAKAFGAAPASREATGYRAACDDIEARVRGRSAVPHSPTLDDLPE